MNVPEPNGERFATVVTARSDTPLLSLRLLGVSLLDRAWDIASKNKSSIPMVASDSDEVLSAFPEGSRVRCPTGFDDIDALLAAKKSLASTRTPADKFCCLPLGEVGVPPSDLDRLQKRASLAAIGTRGASIMDFAKTDVVKVVTMIDGRVMYMSRGPVPFVADPLLLVGSNSLWCFTGMFCLSGIGLSYAVSNKRGFLPSVEKIGLLGLLEAGLSIETVPMGKSFLVDSEEALREAERIVAEGRKKDGKPPRTFVQ